MLGSHSGMIRSVIRVDAKCHRPRFLLGRDALLFRLWLEDFGLRHNGRQRCWTTSHGLVRLSRQFSVNRSMRHGGCLNGGMPMRPMHQTCSAGQECLQQAVALSEHWWPLRGPSVSYTHLTLPTIYSV